MVHIQSEIFFGARARRRLMKSLFARKFEELIKQRNSKLTTSDNTAVGGPLTRNIIWQHIDWKAVENHVYKLQMRIAKESSPKSIS